MLKLHLRDKILIGFGLVVVIMLIVFVVSLSSLLKLGKASEAILQQNYLSIEATSKMRDSIEQHYRLIFDNYYFGKDINKRLVLDEKFNFEHWLIIEKGNITEEGEIHAVRNLETAYKNYLYSIESFLSKSFPTKDMTYQYLQDNVKPELSKIRTYCTQIMNINQNVMYKASNNAKIVAHKATYTLVLIGILGLMLAAILSLSLSSIIVRPLKNILSALEKVTEGDYSTRISYHSSDELGIVSNEFNHMAQKLSEYHEMNIRNILREKNINEAILLNMDDGIFLIDTEYRIANVNLSGARFFNATPEVCMGKHLLEIIKHELLFEFIKDTADRGKSPAFSEGQNILVTEQSNSKQYLQFFLTPVFLQSKELLGVMILFQDITHLKQLDKLKSEFLMIASHELKTPVTSINMGISLLKETAEAKLNDSEKELLQITIDDTNRLKALINDLLDISKIEAGKIDLNFESIPVEGIIDKAVHSFRTVAQENNIILTGNCEPELQVKADFSKIAWVITNLISNALRFTPKDGEVKVKAVKTGSYVQFSVEDNGMGIPYEHQNKIFDKFYQIASPQNTGGTGLGLSICKEIVRAHGGTIWVDSEQNRGSTFFFTLPLA